MDISCNLYLGADSHLVPSRLARLQVTCQSIALRPEFLETVTMGIVKILVTSAIIIVLSACDGSVKGDVFIVKGSGEIAVSPGRSVVFIPVDSEEKLFSMAASVASEAALQSVAGELIELCPSAKKQAEAITEDLSTQVHNITAKDSVPDEGCEELVAAADRLGVLASSIEAENADEIARLTNALTVARSERDKKVTEMAEHLRQKELDKLSVQVEIGGPSYNKRLYWTFNNGSDYCIGPADNEYGFAYLKAKAYAGGVELASESDLMFYPKKDSLGFEIKGCYFQSGEIAKTYNSGAPCSTPVVKKLIREGRVKTKGDCVLLESSHWDFSDHVFLEVSKKDAGETIEYKTSPVNWKAKAQEQFSFASHNKNISEAEKVLAAANERHASNASVSQANAAKKKSELCTADYNSLAELNLTLDKSLKLHGSLSCDAATDQTELARALTAIDSLLDLGLEIPDVKAPYASAFLSEIESIMTSETLISADTSIQGHYTIDSIPPGDYLVMAEYADNFVNGFWLDSVSVTTGEQIIDLNQNTFVSVSLSDYIRTVARSCDTCNGSDPIPSRETVVAAAEALQEELQELKNILEKLKR